MMLKPATNPKHQFPKTHKNKTKKQKPIELFLTTKEYTFLNNFKSDSVPK